MSNYYSRKELLEFRFRSIGEDVLISRKASIYGSSDMIIGNHVRIDDFCFLSGQITLHNYIHIATASLLYGGSEGITMEDFSGLSQRVTVIADSDDYSGESLTNPMTPEKYKNLIELPVYIKKHVIVGTGTVILPGVIIGEGCSIGAMSLVAKSTEPWTINVGIPSKAIKKRSKKLLEFEQDFLRNN